MSHAELPIPYPQTEFINELTEGMNPLGVDLVRGVYLGYIFGQQDNSLTRRFGATAAEEVQFWLPHEKPEYHQVRKEVEDFFKADGADRLARTSFEAIGKPDSDFVRVGREYFIEEAWRACLGRLPSQDRLEAVRPLHQVLSETPAAARRRRWEEAMREDPDEISLRQEVGRLRQRWRRPLGLIRDFIVIDTQHVASDELVPLSPRSLHESLFREAVLQSRPTGSGIFNLLFSNMRDYTAAGLAEPCLAALGRVWSEHHSEGFLPEDYQAFLRSRTISDRLRGLILRRALKGI